MLLLIYYYSLVSSDSDDDDAETISVMCDPLDKYMFAMKICYCFHLQCLSHQW